MTPPTIRLVCLDIGGVLVRICSGWQEACRLAKIAPARALEDPVVLREAVRLSQELEHGRIGCGRFDQEVARLIGATPADVDAAARAWLVEVYPGAIELVRWLSSLPGVRSACLSNTTTRHWEMMTSRESPVYAGLDGLHLHFLSFRIGHMKPAADIYRYVERQTGLRPEEILFFDDSVANVEGARACGWHAELVDSRGDPPGQVRSTLKRHGFTA